MNFCGAKERSLILPKKKRKNKKESSPICAFYLPIHGSFQSNYSLINVYLLFVKVLGYGQSEHEEWIHAQESSLVSAILFISKDRVDSF